MAIEREQVDRPSHHDRVRLEVLLSNGSARTIKSEYEYTSYGRPIEPVAVERFVVQYKREVTKEAARYGLTITRIDVHIDTRKTVVVRETETTVKTELKKQLFPTESETS